MLVSVRTYDYDTDMKRAYLGIGVVAIVVIVAVAALVMNSSQKLPTKYADAKALHASVACEVANTSLKVSGSTQSSIEMAVIGQLIDVPAGTQVDVHVASLSSDTATGSEIYQSDYGTYNFTVKRTAAKDGALDWHVTRFVACTPAPAAQPVSASSTSSASNTVEITNFMFSPASITVKKGTTVTWTNKDSAAHTVTESDSQTGPSSDSLATGKSYSFTYTSAGTFKYKCNFHPDMQGTVVVTE